jgi:hypothetical protein
MNIRYRVDLSQSKNDRLTALLSGGKHPARKLERAQILLAADAGASDAEIAAWLRQRNHSGERIKWMFTVDKARSKMARAYPEIPRDMASQLEES